MSSSLSSQSLDHAKLSRDGVHKKQNEPSPNSRGRNTNQSRTKPDPSPQTTEDRWDYRQIGDLMALRGNHITFTGGTADANGHKKQRGNTAFLCNLVDHGVHRWKFKVKLRFCHWWSATIGIYKCSNGNVLPRNDIFTLGEHQGYGINVSEGTLVDIRTGMASVNSPVEYGKKCIGTHLVEMVLDFDKLELKFVIDGIDYGTAFIVDKGTYRAAVNLSQIGDTVELLSIDEVSELSKVTQLSESALSPKSKASNTTGNHSLSQSNKDKDQWDYRYIGDLMGLSGNQIIFTGGIADANGHRKQKGNTAFLCNIVDDGVHHWKFKVKLRFCHHWSATIGIYKCSNGDALPRNDIFTLGGHRGYGINLSEGKLVPSTSPPAKYGKRCVGTHIVEMVLDYDNLELKFIIDGEDYGTAFTVENGGYRAAVNLSQIGDFVELL